MNSAIKSISWHRVARNGGTPNVGLLERGYSNGVTCVNHSFTITSNKKIPQISDEERTVYGHIGRTLVSPYTTVNIEGGVEVQIQDAILQLSTVLDEARNTKGIKVRWDTQTHPRFEDCISFGKEHYSSKYRK